MMTRFLDSLDRVASLQADDLIVLPGHGKPFSNLAERVAELKAHHGQREAAILEILRSGGPKTVYEIARSLWAKLPGYHLTLGTAEVNAHLEKSVEDGEVREIEGPLSDRLKWPATTIRPAEPARWPAWSARAEWSWGPPGPSDSDRAWDDSTASHSAAGRKTRCSNRSSWK